MAKELLTKDERMELVKAREDYIEIFQVTPELRIENPKLWHDIVDQYEGITEILEEDQTAKCLLTATRKMDDNGKLLIKKLDGKEHPKGEWEINNG
jgi:RNA binding exosome subunit